MPELPATAILLDSKLDRPLPEPEPGLHRWIVVAFWAVAHPETDMLLDVENMLSISPPYCLHCETRWPDEGLCPGEGGDGG